jgi:hypothetical protein
MILLGCKPRGRHTEQHDVFFGIAGSLMELVPQIKRFWTDSGILHIDAWREVNVVGNFRVEIQQKSEPGIAGNQIREKLFFVNLGGYQADKFEEQHYMLLMAKENRALAIKEAKQTLFFKTNHLKGASTHIDDKYGIDVDDIYEIEDVLSPDQKEQFLIALHPQENPDQDHIHLGYLKLSSLK